ncbi:MAG TPA: L,D-transpeptidase/peptidoglycan binding protein [Solirubrobacteraceae bacterium]|nr:L,D-transpeptidase/peptidoglycan binding protein [Solirubrobacteraceae bacterium]
MEPRVEHRISRFSADRRSASPWLVVGVLAAALVLMLVGGMYLYDHAHRDTIAKGVRIDGVAVGGLSGAAALKKVRRAVIDPLSKPLTVRSSAGTWTLGSREARLTVDAQNMVQQALTASREGSIVTRTIRGLLGESVNKDVPLAVSYSHVAVQALTAKVRAAVNRAPQNASVAVSGSELTRVPAKSGVTVDSARLGGRIERALTGASASRAVTVPAKSVQPKITTAQLASEYPAYIVIDRGAFQLRFYAHLQLAKTYPIAVGMQGLETPPGLYHIQWKEVDPPWIVPNKAWAGALAGKTIPPGPEDPLKARFMSFDGGAGIHGIDPSEYGSIGHDASHGCVRMTIPDVIALYSVTPVGTPVYIV